MTRLFDVYIAVDWSSQSSPSSPTPSKDAIWVGEKIAQDIADNTIKAETYWRTRFACSQYLHERLLHHSRLGRRVFIGFDFAYGYPDGFAAALHLDRHKPAWLAVWDELTALIKDDRNNQNNRFEVAAGLNARCGEATPEPFWGCPEANQRPTLKMNKRDFTYPYAIRPDASVENLRWTDSRLRGVQPVWKLSGPGSVGGQSLVGIPVVNRLRHAPALASFSRVWPFETGFTAHPTPETGSFILHVEIWPGVVPEPLDKDEKIRDRAQVRGFVNWLSSMDSNDSLGSLFEKPPAMSSIEHKAVVESEGWVFAAGQKAKP